MVYKKKNVLRRQAQKKKMNAIANKINGEITAPKVHLVGDNVENKICTREEALRLAEEMELDLIEIPSPAEVPVCKILDFSKFKYEQIKKQKRKQENRFTGEVKEIKFNSEIGDHDFETKLRDAVKFLQSKFVVKVSICFRGRAVSFRDHGNELMDKFILELNEFGEAKGEPVFDGNRTLSVTLFPKSKKKG